MKSFDKFEYENTDIHELNIGGYMSSIKTSLRRGNRKGLSDQARRMKDGFDKNTKSGKIPQSAIDTSQDSKKAQPLSMKPIKKGIGKVMDRTKKAATRAKKFAGSEKGRAAGRGLTGAAKGLLDYKPDKERTDTGQGGMGTALRQMTGVGQAAMQGAIKAPAERINPNQRKTLGGKLLAIGKEKAQIKTLGIDPTERTDFGRKFTGDTSPQARKEREERMKRSVEKSVNVSGKTKKRYNKIKDMNVSTLLDRIKSGTTRSGQDASAITGKMKGSNSFQNRLQKNTRDSEADKRVAAAEKDPDLKKIEKEITQGITPDGKRTVASMNPDEKRRRGIGGGSTSGGSTEGGGGAGGKKPYKAPSKTESQNIQTKSVINQSRKKNQSGKKYSKGGGAESGGGNQKENINPIKKNNTSDSRQANQTLRKNKRKRAEKIIKDIQKEETNMNLKELNVIKQRRELAKQPNQGKMRTYAQIQQDKLKAARDKQLKSGSVISSNESYSHWREEFIWETEKKYPDKIKEIKPMTGKNTITINPEDETSKYKRGY